MNHLPLDQIPSSQTLPTGAWDGREAFAQLLRQAFVQAGRAGWQKIVLSDPDFEGWPLGERAVIESLQSWAQRGRELHWIAHDYRWLRSHAPRLVQWRVTWDHIVQARSLNHLGGVTLPSALWTPEWCLERVDVERSRGISTVDAKRLAAVKNRLDSCWDQSSAAFPASVLGL